MEASPSESLISLIYLIFSYGSGFKNFLMITKFNSSLLSHIYEKVIK